MRCHGCDTGEAEPGQSFCVACEGESLDLTGMVAYCSLGRAGLITGTTEAPWGETYYGIGLDGKGLWMSRNPRVIAIDAETYANTLLKRARVNP